MAFHTSFLGGKWVVSTVHLPLPAVNLTATPEVKTRPRSGGGSAHYTKHPSPKRRWKPETVNGRIQMKALFCLATEVHQTLGGLMRTRLGSGCSRPLSRNDGSNLAERRALRRNPGSHQTAPADQCVVSSNKRVSCSLLKTMAALERVCFLSKDGLLL